MSFFYTLLFICSFSRALGIETDLIVSTAAKAPSRAEITKQRTIFFEHLEKKDLKAAIQALTPSILCRGFLDMVGGDENTKVLLAVLNMGAKDHELWLLQAIAYMAENGNRKQLEILLNHLGEPREASLEQRKQYYLAGLSLAAGNGHKQTFKTMARLLPEWTQMKFENRPHNLLLSPVHVTINKKNFDTTMYFLKRGARWGVVNRRGRDEATLAGDGDLYKFEIVLSALKNQIAFARQESNPESIFYKIKELPTNEERRAEIYQLLRDCPALASVHLRDAKRNTILHAAALIGDSKLFGHIVYRNRLLINERNEDGHTPLMLAIGFGKFETKSTKKKLLCNAILDAAYYKNK